VTVQMTALALVVGNAVAGVELEAAGDEHRKAAQSLDYSTAATRSRGRPKATGHRLAA